ncbi:RHS repeat-associated core domain-containing protein [Fangia hongkongensis]|uniref:RHS repeat-associated core domain-containing protein n=3 Tax=Fangia hongkongensis TaxID=270495 RepID=UPI00036A5466|nr:RHS repeat-associated core domain-containing protein [Fangia hongkongensis]
MGFSRVILFMLLGMLLSLQFVFSLPAYVNNVQTLTLAGDPYGYDNEYQDGEDGTVYLRARNYDAKSGKFISQDSYDFFNRYLSFSANPVGDVDPSGHAAVSFFTQHYWHKKSNRSAIAVNIVSLIVGEAITGVAGYYTRYSNAKAVGAVIGGLSGGFSSLAGILTQAGLSHNFRSLGTHWARNFVNFDIQVALGGLIGMGVSSRSSILGQESAIAKNFEGEVPLSVGREFDSDSSSIEDDAARGTKYRLNGQALSADEFSQQRKAGNIPDWVHQGLSTDGINKFHEINDDFVLTNQFREDVQKTNVPRTNSYSVDGARVTAMYKGMGVKDAANGNLVGTLDLTIVRSEGRFTGTYYARYSNFQLYSEAQDAEEEVAVSEIGADEIGQPNEAPEKFEV